MRTTQILKLVVTFVTLLILTVPSWPESESTTSIDSRDDSSGKPALADAQFGPMSQTNLIAREYVSSVRRQDSAIKEALEGRILHEALQAKIETQVTPGQKMELFLKEIARWRAEGRSDSEVAERLGLLSRKGNPSEGGWIEGYITVDSNPASVLILAFDEFGFFADGEHSYYYDGNYSFWLPEGKYYVMTFSQQYIDELYEDVPALLGSFENWRQATLLDLSGGTSFDDVNFDLQDGAHISGVIYEQDGVTPLEYEDVIFTITRSGSPDPISTLEVSLWEDGAYTITIPLTGEFKIHAEVEDYGGKWFDGKETWEEADPVTVTTLGDTTKGIDFIAETGGSGGTIGGSVNRGDGGGSMDFALVVAFNMADTSMAGLGITIFGSYTIEGLPDGDYLLYTDDFIGNLLGYGNWVGEYYEDAYTPDQATLVTISEENRRWFINFTLEAGGSIGGTVLGPDETPVDSILVLAINADILNFDPFFSNIVLTLALTDSDGRYIIGGLPSGQYVLRTFTPGQFELDLWFWYFYVPGTHYGRVIDEYYGGIQDLFSFSSATRVSVTAPDMTTGIDFTLDAAGAISGVVQEASEGYTIEDVYIFAFDPVTQLPLLAYGISDWMDGSYLLAPLPEGQFVVSAIFLTESDYEGNQFLSEFYDGVQTFEKATLVSVHKSDTTSSIDFTIDLGSTINGHVNLDEGFSAGADSLWRFPVVAYETFTGEMVNLGWASFSGGYRIPKLPAGSYKVCALPGFYGYAATYYGGGTTYDDANSATIQLTPADTFRADITVGSARGSISGFVHNMQSGDPLTSSMVIAYDPTGHAAGFGFAGYDWPNEQSLDNNGMYEIQGLRTGTYALRTWSIMSLLLQYRYLFEGFELDLGSLDVFGILGLVLGVDLGTEAYEDKWYENVSIPFAEYDFINIVRSGLLYGLASQYDPVPFTFYAPFPFYEDLQGVQVSVTAPDETPGINFGLSPMGPGDIFTDVTDDGSGDVTVPGTFVLQQNYPNPFNPSTDIRYQIAERGDAIRTTLKIYNVLGQEIRTLVDEVKEPGFYSVRWDGRDQFGNDVASGIYFYQLNAAAFTSTKRMVLMR